MKEVYPSIFLIEEKGRFRPSDNIYVIAGNDGIIFDAGYGYKKAIKFFLKEFKEIQNYYEKQKKEFKISRIIISHAHSDHFSGISPISNTLGLKIVLTENIAKTIKDKVSFETNFRGDDYEDYLRVRNKLIQKMWNGLRHIGTILFFRSFHGLSYLDQPDEIVDENSVILINGEPWKIFPSPGHSPEHISLYSEEKGILFSGDNVLKMRSTWLGPPESDVADYIKTIKKLQKLPNLKLILPAHDEIIENPKDTLTAIMERMNERQEQVLDAIKNYPEKGVSPDQILEVIYPKTRRFTRIIGRDWVVLTLKFLEKKGIIRRELAKKKILFFLS
ncbi:MAG: MBL fold metallo-hydrolase [Promethearchaeota archaeon]|jgi:glyoxylase-like metal-dependent hydrolase (beta-lactamase superfamily II)